MVHGFAPEDVPEPMHAFPWFDVAIILLLIAINGVFAMSELAIVSSRRPRLQAMEKAGRHGATTAILLAAEPGRFLSTVQIGITAVGIVAGAYSGASLGGPMGERLQALGLAADTAQTAGFAVVIALTTYASLMIGELIPKQFALRSPEPIACFMAPILAVLSRVGAPVVWLLDQSSALAFRVMRLNRESEAQVTAEELHLVVAEATSAGVIEESERQMISGVMRLADRPVRGVMTPRGEVDWLDADADDATIRARFVETQHTRMAVAEGSIDKIVGIVQARDVVQALIEGKPLDLRQLVRRAPVIPDMADATDALAVLQRAAVPMALVHDEYGHFEGLITPADLLAAIAGVFVSDEDADSDPPLVQREDGSWLVSGSLPVDEMAERLGIDLDEDRDFHTAAGYALAAMKRIPVTGDVFTADRWRFEIVDMDGRKIDKLIASAVLKRSQPDG